MTHSVVDTEKVQKQATKLVTELKHLPYTARLKRLNLHALKYGEVTSQLCGHNTIFILWGNTPYCVQLSGEDLLHYSNKIQSVGFRKCSYYRYLTMKVISQ